jgi:outer membrane immunogenic protein
MRTTITAALLLTAAAAPASAQAVEGSWTGFNAGLRAGWNFQPKDKNERISFDTNLDGNFGDTVRTGMGADAFSPGFCGGAARIATPAGGCAKDKNNLEWAAHVGYDLDLGGPVVGVVGEFGAGYGSDSVSGYSTTPANYVMTRTQRYTYGVRARAGYALGPQRDTLAYVTGGVLQAKIDNEFRSTNTANSFAYTGDSTRFGWRAGAGVDQRVHRNLSIGLLYLFTSIDDGANKLRTGPGTAAANNPFRLVNTNGTDFTRTGKWFRSHSVSAGATVRF